MRNYWYIECRTDQSLKHLFRGYAGELYTNKVKAKKAAKQISKQYILYKFKLYKVIFEEVK